MEERFQLLFPHFRVLDESPHFMLGYEWETVLIIDKRSGDRRIIAEHRGDPTCGVISPDEKWFAVGGEGVTLLDISGGFATFFRPGDATGWVELLDNRTELIAVHGMRLDTPDNLRVLFDPWSSYAAVWRLNVRLRTAEKLHDGPFLAGEPYREDVAF